MKEQLYFKYKNDFNKLSDQTKAILLGLVLGNGKLTLDKTSNQAKLIIRHSKTQQEYFE